MSQESESKASATSGSPCELDQPRTVVRLPRKLAERVRQLSEEPLLDYREVSDFVLLAVEHEVDRATLRLEYRRKREAER